MPNSAVVLTSRLCAFASQRNADASGRYSWSDTHLLESRHRFDPTRQHGIHDKAALIMPSIHSHDIQVQDFSRISDSNKWSPLRGHGCRYPDPSGRRIPKRAVSKPADTYRFIPVHYIRFSLQLRTKRTLGFSRGGLLLLGM